MPAFEVPTVGTLPVSLAEAKAQLRVLDDEQDTEIIGFLHDAAAWVENYTGQLLWERVVTEQFRVSPRGLELSGWPVFPDASLVVTHEGAGGTGAALGTRLDLSRRPARVLPAAGSCWPWAGTGQTVTVTYQAGYQHADDVPRNLRRAMLVLIAAYDADREGGEVLARAEAAAIRLCRDFKVHRV